MEVGVDQDRTEQGQRRAKPPDRDPRLVKRGGVHSARDERLVEPEMAEAGLDDDREGLRDRHSGVEPDLFRLVGPGVPGLEQPEAALRLAHHAHAQDQPFAEHLGEGEQVAAGAALELELDLADRRLAAVADHPPFVEDQLDFAGPQSDEPGGAPDLGFRHRAQALAHVAPREELADRSRLERLEIELRRLDPGLPFRPAREAARIGAALLDRLVEALALPPQPKRIARLAELAFVGVEIGGELIDRPARRIAEHRRVAKRLYFAGRQLQLQLDFLRFDHRSLKLD